MKNLRIFLYAFAIAAALLGATLNAVAAPEKNAAQDSPLAYVVKVEGIISPATDELITRHLQHAAKAKADVVVLQMHTPGGLYDSMQHIIQKILDSPVPVVTYVSPAGSHAASAGTYILYASHIAAMAPGTNIGAATPIQMGGGPSEDKPDATMPKKGAPKSTLEQKMVNDASAYIRGLAELRGRNVEWAEKSVRAAESLTASEALSKKVIDVIADDLPGLLDKIDGRAVQMQNGDTHKLDTKNARIDAFEADWRTKILGIITHPNVALLLMTLGMYGLIYEFAHPGAFLPGIAGGICLLLGLFAMNVMPINYAGLALVVIGLLLMAAEAIVPSFGALGIGGLVAFIAGGVMLIDSDVPGFGIDLWALGGMALVSAGLLSVVLAYALKAQRRPKTTGIEELLSASCEVLHWHGGRGEVRVTGEIWQAVADPVYIFNKGDMARITAVNDLKLTIAPQNK